MMRPVTQPPGMLREITHRQEMAVRQLRSAAGAAWSCGVLSLIFAALASLPLMLALLVGRTRAGPGHIVYFAAVCVTMVLPAAAYFIAAGAILRATSWGLMTAVVLATGHAACALVGLVAIFWVIPHYGGPVIFPAAAGAIPFLVLCPIAIVRATRAMRGGADSAQAEAIPRFPVVAPSGESSELSRFQSPSPLERGNSRSAKG